MNKLNLTETLAKETGLMKGKVAQVVNLFFDEISDTLTSLTFLNDSVPDV